MSDVLDRLAGQLVARVTEHVTELLVGIEQHSVEIGARDPDRRILEHGTVTFFVHPRFGHILYDAYVVLGRAVRAPRDGCGAPGPDHPAVLADVSLLRQIGVNLARQHLL